MPSSVNFEGAGAGICLVWHLSYEDGLTGAEVGMNTNSLQGCYSLSNPITVMRADNGSLCQSENNLGQIIINEVIDNGDQIELSNTGGMSIDISSYWLCDFPNYQQLSNMNIVCGGDLILDPGETLTVSSDFITVSTADGELGLYLNSSFGNANSMIDYVEWGSTSHQRSNVAVAAGIWSTGDFVSAFDANNSILFDGFGDTSSDWYEGVPNACVSNCNIDGGSLTGGPFCFCVSDGNADNITAGSIVLSGNNAMNSQWVVTDSQGNILGLPPMPSVVDFDGAGFGTLTPRLHTPHFFTSYR